MPYLRPLAWTLGFGVAVGIGWGCAKDVAGEQDCPVGSIGCPCTGGGTCDVDLSCVGEVCMDIDNATMSSTVTATGTPGDPTATTTGTGGETSSTSDSGLFPDFGAFETDTGPVAGCRAVDMLFVLDASGSMAQERNALAAVSAFSQIIGTLEGINGGGINYRIGLTDDNDNGWYVPSTWVQPNPWFDKQEFDAQIIAGAFNGAVQQLGLAGGAPAGCEHVLTSGIDLLAGDTTGFVRENALLVLVLLTDVDDHGAYEQPGGFDCQALIDAGYPEFVPEGCMQTPTGLDVLESRLVDDVKGGVAESVAVIAIAGDPEADAGVNFCDQPGSCGCAPDPILGVNDCAVFHATRIGQFVDDLGENGVFDDLCTGNVPDTVRTVIESRVDQICMDYEPEG
jgi:type IV secretory pathway VirB2 component (pilin)